MRWASDTSPEQRPVAVEAPRPSFGDNLEPGFVVTVEQLVGDCAGRRLVGELERRGAEPLHADDGDQAVGMYAADGAVRAKVFKSHGRNSSSRRDRHDEEWGARWRADESGEVEIPAYTGCYTYSGFLAGDINYAVVALGLAATVAVTIHRHAHGAAGHPESHGRDRTRGRLSLPTGPRGGHSRSLTARRSSSTCSAAMGVTPPRSASV